MTQPIPPQLAARLERELVTRPTVLSDRETDVLALYACGYNGREIAERLHLSHWTVETHARRLRAKLHARTLAQAVALALVRGLLDPALIAD